jgi:glycosyltransferase involved in cell wall biosynthesis
MAPAQLRTPTHDSPLTVAWISDFPVEWLPDLPEPLRSMPRRHPATWMIVLMEEFQKTPNLRLHIILLRHRMERSFSFERGGVTFHVLKAKPLARLASFFWLDTFLIRKTLKSVQPDLVHAWGNEKGAAMIADRLGYPYLMTVQGLYAWYKEIVPLHGYEKLMSRFEASSVCRAPIVTTESNFPAKYLRDHHPGINVLQVEHSPSGIFAQVKRRPVIRPISFISNGTLGYRKGTDLLFKALDKLAPEVDYKLTLICNHNPQQIEHLRQQSSAALWSRVEFKHNVPPEDVAAHLATPTMMLMPTRADTGPIAVKEAVVAGVPVLASNLGGIPDYVIPGKNGVLFESGDLDGFVKAIRAAIEHPLFSKGLVDADTLSSRRDYLSSVSMAENFTRAYRMALSACRSRRER